MQFVRPWKLFDLAVAFNKRLIGVDVGSSCTGLCVVDVVAGMCFRVKKEKPKHLCPEFPEYEVLRPGRMSNSTMAAILNRIATKWDAVGCLIGYNYGDGPSNYCDGPSGDYNNHGAKFTKVLVSRLRHQRGLVPGLFTFVNEYGSTKAGVIDCQQSYPILWNDALMHSLYPHISHGYLLFLRKSYCDGFAALKFSEDFILNAKIGLLYATEFDREMQSHLETVAKGELGFDLEGDYSYTTAGNGRVFVGRQRGK